MLGRAIAIDYGQKRTGLAISDPDRKFAFPLETVATFQLETYVKKCVVEQGITAFVVGEPKDLLNRPSSIAPKIEIFIAKLKSLFPSIPVYRVDERFSSSMATQAIRDSGASKKDRQKKALVDVVSATILLQSWITAQELQQ
jgi:putative Holliday junction resolvase